MASYYVMMSGTGISVPSEPDPVIGLFTSRKVRASSAEKAIRKAKDVVLAEWMKDGEYAEVNNGELPDLVIEEYRKLGLLESFFPRFPTRGYTFYQNE